MVCIWSGEGLIGDKLVGEVTDREDKLRVSDEDVRSGN